MYSITEQMVAWLAARGYDASTHPRKDSEPPFVTVERVGGRVEDHVDHPSIAVQAWGATDAEAEQLANEVRLALLTGSLPAGVHSVSVNSGPYRFYDGATRSPRYQMALDVTSQLTE